MKCVIPEISWHNRDPVLSIDVQVKNENEPFYRLVSGGTDSHVLIWHVFFQEDGTIKLDCVSDLTRHHKAVNAVRFSPSGLLLASGDDESAIILWRKKEAQEADLFEDGDAEVFQEHWVQDKVLRGHLNDIYDLSWSPDSTRLISGSVDNTAIIWDVVKGKKIAILDDHKNFVQGVSWDPQNEVVATMSSDSVCRVFSTKTLKPVSRMSKTQWFSQAEDAKPSRLFHDDTLKTFFRRLSFSPDGRLLIVPSGIFEDSGSKPKYVTWIFPRKHFGKPVMFFPTQGQSATVVKCCPVLYKLRDGEVPVFALPYRMVIAVATKSSILLYDTQHAVPIALITNIHYTKITDLSWSSDGRLLIASSTDGYCSLISFGKDELGTHYLPPPASCVPISSGSEPSSPLGRVSHPSKNNKTVFTTSSPMCNMNKTSSTSSTPMSSDSVPVSDELESTVTSLKSDESPVVRKIANEDTSVSPKQHTYSGKDVSKSCQLPLDPQSSCEAMEVVNTDNGISTVHNEVMEVDCRSENSSSNNIQSSQLDVDKSCKIVQASVSGGDVILIEDSNDEVNITSSDNI